MDSNKDEAERCIELAVRFIGEEKYQEAEKFLRKAKKLYPTKKVDEILAKVANLSKQNQKSQPESDVRRRQTTNNKENIRPQATTEYTADQLEAVKRVKKCKDYYQMLGVTKEATDNEIKKAYKKLALQLHPDKNKAPGAAEAFKVVGNAVAILIDVEKRKQYDMYGCNEERMMNRNPHGDSAHYDYARRFEGDITAEELFNMFFGGGFSQQEFYIRRPGGRWMRQTEQSQHSHSQQAHGYTSFLQMFPVLLLIVLTMMSSFFISDPVYDLHQSPKYSVLRRTQNLQVPYYVKENFHSEYQGSLRRLEMSVEEEYIKLLKLSCYREKHYKESMLWKARNLGNQEEITIARNLDTPSCKRLQELQAV